MKAISIIAVALSLSACATAPLSGTPVRSDGLAMIGESTRVGALVVTPQAVVEDSRCPINARCVWAGRLIVKSRIDGAGWRETVDLTLGQQYATHGMGLALVSAEPGKVAGATRSPPASLFGFEAR
jgi:hypothetical protein